MKTYKQLEDMSSEHFKVCLKKFIDNFSFIEWIKKNAPSIKFNSRLANIIK